MNIKHAKVPSLKETLRVQFSHLGQQLGCHRGMLFDGVISENIYTPQIF